MAADKKKVQHQIWLANESPEPVFDLSDCKLTEIPPGTYATCKHLLKEALILHTNSLTLIADKKNHLESLQRLLILDLHDNGISKLPKEVKHLSSLQVLNLSRNKLKVLPPEIKYLHYLQTLNLSDNQLKQLPGEIGHLRRLRSLNISSNQITKLPAELCHVRTLESLQLDVPRMIYPDSITCGKGIEAIMRKLCADSNTEYVPASKAVLPTLSEKSCGATSQIPDYLLSDHPDYMKLYTDTDIHELQITTESTVDTDEQVVESEVLFKVLPLLTFMDLTDLASSLPSIDLEERKRLEREEILRNEREERENQEKIAQRLRQQDLAIRQALDQQSRENEASDAFIEKMQSEQEKKRRELLQQILNDDKRSHQVITEIIKRNYDGEEARQRLVQMEEERMKEQAQMKIRAEELTMLRREEMMANMRFELNERKEFDKAIRKYLDNKDEELKRTRNELLEEETALTSKLKSDQNYKKQQIINDMLKEEEYQKKVFEAMMKSRDARHATLSNDIQALEEQLAKLSIIEISCKAEADTSRKRWLEEQRQEMTRLLMRLIDERDQRSKQLRNMLLDMEREREEESIDFWLAQMQRLMDRKPHALIDKESQLELAVIDILQLADADDYRSSFARHKISIESMSRLTDADLKTIGVHEVGKRKSILEATQMYLRKISDTDQSTLKNKMLSEEGSATISTDSPSAPTSDVAQTEPTASTDSTSTSSRPSQLTAHVTTECVICLDRLTNIVFLPCGHVCCCQPCCESLLECPMCRAEITQKIILER